MQFITKLLVIVSVVVVANAAPINDNMAKRDTTAALAGVVVDVPESSIIEQRTTQTFSVGKAFTGINQTGSVAILNVNAIPSACFNFITFQDNLSSISVDKGITCTFFIDPSCQGASVIVQDAVVAPNLSGTNYDDSISSYRCSAV